MKHRDDRRARAFPFLAGFGLLLGACGDDAAGIVLIDAASPSSKDAEKTEAGMPLPEASAIEASTEAGDASPSVADATAEAMPDVDAAMPEEDAGLVTKGLCLFHSAPIPDPPPKVEPGNSGSDAGDAGADQAAPEPTDAAIPPSIGLEKNPFVGQYLIDRKGHALYIYGADFPGDCENQPVSNCEGDCAVSWPVFNAGERDLGEGLDDSVFGTIERSDGSHQTTYYGWPLYYYKKDESGTVLGQSKGSIWFAAEAVMPNIMIMRTPAAAGGAKYLSDGTGRTLYASDSDIAGTQDKPPASACTNDCLDAFLPFSRNSIAPVSSLEPFKLTVFLRSDGQWQIAYGGRPLYYAAGDRRSGDLTGVEEAGWTLVEP